jgi:serine protease Do
MNKQLISIGRWAAILSMVLALALGGLLGSLATAKAGTPVPMWVSTDRPVVSSRVSLDDGFAPAVKHVVPAVVNISSARVVRTSEGANPFAMDPFFRQFFGDRFFRNVPRERREKSLGSGVIVSPDGYVLTNNHVVDDSSQITVTLADKREFKARVIGKDARSDVAVLKLDATNLPYVAFGDSSKVQVGDLALAVGDPFGIGQTVTMGIISATGRGGLGIEDYEDFIQTDAAINPGNSGGALVNVHGDLIGINTAILSGGSGGNQGIGFAIPVNMARGVMTQIMKHGKVVRSQLGVLTQEVSPSIAKAFGLSKPAGALVSDVLPNSPAARSGLKRGDVITAIDGSPVSDSNQLRLMVSMMAPGTTTTLKVLRNGAEQDFSATLSELRNQAESRDGGSRDSGDVLEGISVDELTPDMASELRLPSGTKGVVVTQVDQSGPAAEIGLHRGDVIQEVNRKPVANVADFETAARQADKESVLLLVNRKGSTFYVVAGAR